MADIDRSEASIRFIGDNLDPDEISARLGVTPTHAVAKGALWSTPKGADVVARVGTWLLKAPSSSPGNIDRQVNDLFSGMSGDLDGWQEIAGRYDGHVFAGMFLAAANEAFHPKPPTVLAIASRGLALDVDIYGFGEDEEAG